MMKNDLRLCDHVHRKQRSEAAQRSTGSAAA